MKYYTVRVYSSKEKLPKENQLAYLMAKMATERIDISTEVEDMVINRIIDNASVAISAINRLPVANARSQALCHSKEKGATVFGMPNYMTFSAEWGAWANGTAVRELDYHDTFLAVDYSHPADNIPPLLAVAQTKGSSGLDLLYAIITSYEIQVNLVKSICLHEYKKDHIAHLGVAVAGGLGTLLNLDVETIFQSINQAVHITFSTRQSRKGEISSWKAYAPAFAGKMGIESVDRAMRGEQGPSPIYEGEDSVIAWMLGGNEQKYQISLPEKGEEKRAILDTYTKEHSAEYQSQALIDLAFDLRNKINDIDTIEKIVIHTSHHTHYVIGTGAGDPQKMDPNASRETLDHSIMYIFAVALEDGTWHHVNSYTKERANRESTINLWNKISTVEDEEWTKRYHNTDPNKKAFGGKVQIFMKNGSLIEGEKAVANAHIFGDRPFMRKQYINKFKTLTKGMISDEESERFLTVVQNLRNLKSGELNQLNVQVPLEQLKANKRDTRGIF